MIKKDGFVLLEVLIASAIGAFIMMALYQVLSQTNLSVVTMERISSIDMRQLLVQNQLERDLLGVFVAYERKAKTGEQKEPAKKDGGKGDDLVKAGTGAGAGAGKKEQYEDVPIKRVFFSKNSGDNLEILTFITNNPLKSFSRYSTIEKPKPLIARVVYKLVSDKQQARGAKAGEKVSFKLFRQESEFLGFDEFEKIKPISYEVAKNIKKMSVEYTVAFRPEQDKEKEKKDASGKSQDQKDQKEQKKQEPAKEEKVQYKTFKNWTEAEIKSTKKQRPDICRFIIEFWDDTQKTAKTFEFKIYIYTQEQKPQPKPQANTQTNINLDVSVNKNGLNNGLGKNTNARNNNLGARNSSRNNNTGNNGANNGGNRNNRRKPSIFDVFLTGKR